MNESEPQCQIGRSVDKFTINDIAGLDPENLFFDTVKGIFLTDNQYDDLTDKINSSPNEGWILGDRITPMHVVDGKIEAKKIIMPNYSQQLGARAMSTSVPMQETNKSSKLTTEQVVQNIHAIRARIKLDI